MLCRHDFRKPSVPSNRRTFRLHYAFTIVELLVAISIISLLLGLSLVGIQRVREAARRTECLDHLRQLALAAHSFESAHRRLPPGQLGHDWVLTGPVNDVLTNWSDEASPEYWKRSQHTSCFVILLPYLEQVPLHRTLPRIAVNWRSGMQDSSSPMPPDQWLNDFSEVVAAAAQPLPNVLCPSDDLGAFPAGDGQAAVADQPAYLEYTFEWSDELLYVPLEKAGIPEAAGTNYLACAGAHSGGEQFDPELKPFIGVMSCRQEKRIGRQSDGSSQTIMFGETIGTLEDGKRLRYRSWFFGALGRGRGGLSWGAEFDPDFPAKTYLGDANNSNWTGFGSKHTGLVNFACVDGSTRSIARDIEKDVFYAYCGANDGMIISNDDQ